MKPRFLQLRVQFFTTELSCYPSQQMNLFYIAAGKTKLIEFYVENISLPLLELYASVSDH